MAASDEHKLTELLRAWAQGDRQALEELTPRVYAELHRLANLYMARERPNHPLQTTALINEAYIRLIDWKDVRWQSRTHFFAMAARLMREILVDHARRKNAVKRGRGMTIVTLDDVIVGKDQGLVDVLALDEALTDLASVDERLCRVVELRFFAGLSIAETADALDVSSATVERDWTVAKAWLLQRLSSPPQPRGSG